MQEENLVDVNKDLLQAPFTKNCLPNLASLFELQLRQSFVVFLPKHINVTERGSVHFSLWLLELRVWLGCLYFLDGRWTSAMLILQTHTLFNKDFLSFFMIPLCSSLCSHQLMNVVGSDHCSMWTEQTSCCGQRWWHSCVVWEAANLDHC